MARYRTRGVAGVYTTDSDGEFYALEFDQFQELVSMFARAVSQSKMEAAVGVTWSHTAGIIDRIKCAVDAGIPLVHVAFPYWMPLAPSDVPRFFDDLAEAVPSARWIHYRTPRSHVLLSGAEYAHYQRTHPEQLVGTKLVTTDVVEIASIIAQTPDLSHFVTDYCSVTAKLAGTHGVYSYWVNTLPDWTLETWRLAEEGHWEEAARRQSKLILWEKQFIGKLRQMGHNHGVIGKARAALTDFLIDNGLTRPPYYPIDPNVIEDLRQDFLRFWRDELATRKAG